MAHSPFRLVLEEHEERPIRLGKGRATIGRSRACDIVIPFGGLELRHARLRVDGSAVAIERASPGARLVVNGVAVERATLTVADQLVLGEVRLRLERQPEHRPEHRPEGRRDRRAEAWEAESKPAAPTSEGRPALAPAGVPAPARAEPAALPGDWVEVLERLHDWGRGGSLDRRGAMLGLLVDAFALRGAVLLRPRADGGLAALNAWGEVVDLLGDRRVTRALQEATGSELPVSVAEDDLVVVAGGRDGSALALAVRSCSGGAEQLAWPLRLAFRFLAHELFRDQLRLAAPPAPPAALAFSAGMVVGRSPAILRTYQELRRIAAHSLPVVLRGETGSGKGVLARLLHQSGPRAGSPLLVVDGGSAEMLSDPRRVARLTRPAGRRQRIGTVILDGLTAIAPAAQAKLVTLLDGLGRAAADGEPDPPRFIATLADPPEEAIASGLLRHDLYYRLAGFEVRVPPLRERRADVPLLFDHFLGEEMGAARAALSPEALAALTAHAWPGNLRELRHEAARVAARVRGSIVTLGDLSPAVRAVPAEGVGAAAEPDSLDLERHFREVERQVIGRALARAGDRLAPAAELLGISRNRLRRRLRELGIGAGASEGGRGAGVGG